MDFDLNDSVRLRSWIEPPGFFYELDDSEPSVARADYGKLIGPHWDPVSESLAGGGYAEILRLRSRLRKHVGVLEEEHERFLSTTLRPVVFLIRELDKLAAEYGPEATLYDAAGPPAPSPRPPEEGAVWLSSVEGYNADGPKPDWSSPSMYSFYLYISPATLADMGLGPNQRPAPHVLESIKGTRTLRSAREDSYATYTHSKAWSELCDRRVQLAKFKLRVVEQALLEHELLGSAGLFEERPQARMQAYDGSDAEAVTFLVKIWEVHNEDEMLDSRHKLYIAVADDLDLPLSRVRKAMERSGAHIPTGNGPSGNEGGFAHLLRCAEDAHRRNNS